MKKFTHLHIPETWKHYWTKYPEGYTILESLFSWVSQVNDMVDEQNKLNTTVEEFIEKLTNEMADFISGFSSDLQQTVTDILVEWQESGFLNVIINEALETKTQELERELHRLDDKEKETVGKTFSSGKIVSFVDDDGSIRAKTILIEQIFEPAGVPLTMAVNTGTIGNNGKLTKENLLELQSKGHSIISHGELHTNYTTVSENVVRHEMKVARDTLREWGLTGYDIHAYPYGANNADIQKIAKEYYRMAMGVNGTGYNTMPIRQFYVYRHGLKNLSVQDRKNIIDNAPEESWIIFFDHVAEGHFDSPGTIQDYQETVEYVKSQDIPILNVEDAYRIKANVIDVGIDYSRFQEYFRVGANGIMEMTYSQDHSIDINTPLEHFKLGTTKVYFNSPDATSRGFPKNGVLVVERPNSDKYSSFIADSEAYQMYLTSDNVVRKRYWNRSEKTWGNFEILTKQYIFRPERNARTSDTEITSYRQNATEIFYYNSVGSSGFPFEAGTVETIRPGENRWGRQIVYDYYTNKMATRHQIESGWSGFASIPYVMKNLGITVNETIPAGSRITKTVSSGTIKNGQTVQFNPKDYAVPDGIIWNEYSKEGTAILIINNTGGNDIQMDNVRWELTQIEA